MREPLRLFIGYDSREDDAYKTCISSVFRHASFPLATAPLSVLALRRAGLYSRAYRMEDGQRYDLIDRKPFSTEFAFTRFLVPALMQYDGWAIFCDCDFLFTADINKVMDAVGAAGHGKALYVVKQQQAVSGSCIKMDGQIQSPYRRKNWSSFMVFDCSHPSHKYLTPMMVNNEEGSWLHQFGWLRDSEIGFIPDGWNYLVDIKPALSKLGHLPPALHYTLGGPWFKGQKCNDAIAEDLWRSEARRAGLKGY